MLKALRNKETQKRIYMLVAVAVVATFAVSGVILSGEEGKGTTALGVIGKHKISAQEYLASYRAVDRQFSWMFGDKLKDMRKYMNLKGEAWDRILLLDYAKKEKISVPDKEVVTWITSQATFQSQGRFDDHIYKLYVQQAFRTDARQFEEEIRQMLTISKIQEKMRAGVSITDEEVKKLYTEANKERDIQYSVLLIDEKIEGQKTPEDALKKLEAAKDKIEWKSVEKFNKSNSPHELGPFPTLSAALSSLKEGQTSPAFQVPGGAAVLKITKDYPIDEKKFETDKEKFKQEVLDGKAQEQMRNLLNKLRNELKMNLEVMKQLFPDEETK